MEKHTMFIGWKTHNKYINIYQIYQYINTFQTETQV